MRTDSFLVGQSIQGLIGTYKYNIHNFTEYVVLTLSFIKKFIQNEYNVR